MNDAQIKFQVLMDDKQAQKSVSDLASKTKNLGKTFQNTGAKMTAGLTVPIVGFLGMSGKMAMELEATEAKYNTVFKGMTDTSDQFIKDFQKLTPATTASARSMASGIQDLLVPMGFMRKEATELTGDTMHLIGALTNFNSATHSAEDVATAFQAALTGETQSLKRLGIQVDANTLSQRAMAMTGKTNTDELTKQDKALALMELAYEQSGDALAAYNEESLDTKTKLDLATKGFQDQMAVLGKQLIPLFTKAVNLLTKLTTWFSNLSESQQKTMLIVLGVVAALGPLLMIIGKLMVMLPALKAFFIGLNLPLVAIIAGIALLVGAFLYLWNTSEKFRDAVGIIFNSMLEFAKPVFEAIKTILKGLISFIEGFVLVIGGLLTGDFKMVANGFGKIFKGIGNVIIGVLNMAINTINKFIQLALLPLNNMIKAFNIGLKAVGMKPIGEIKIAIPKIPSLDVGTNFVGRDGLAFLHKGEAVVPKKYNPAVGGSGMMTLYIEQPPIELDGQRMSRGITPYITRTIKVGGGNV